MLGLKGQTAYAQQKQNKTSSGEVFNWNGKVVDNYTGQSLDGLIVKTTFIDPVKGEWVMVDTTRGGGIFRYNQTTTGVDKLPDQNIPETLGLEQNYPNPFNPTTTIEFKVKENSPVKLEIFNQLGQKVKTLVDENLAPGKYRVVWGADNEMGQGVAAGAYYSRLIANGKQKVRAMVKNDGGTHSYTSGLAKVGSVTENDFPPVQNAGADDMSSTTHISMKMGGETRLAANPTVKKIEVYGANVLPQTFVPGNIILPDNYDFGLLKVGQGNRLSVGPVVELGTNVPLENMLVQLGSDTSRKGFTDANGIAYLYTTKVGRDSVHVLGKVVNGKIDSTYYFWTHPEVDVVKGENKVTEPFENRVRTFQRMEDEIGRDGLEFLKELFYIHSSFKSDSVFKQTANLLDLTKRGVFMEYTQPPYSPEKVDSLADGLIRAADSLGIQLYREKDSTKALVWVSYTHPSIGGTIISPSDVKRDPVNGYTVGRIYINMGSKALPIRYAIQTIDHEFGAHGVTGGSPFHSKQKQDESYENPIGREDANIAPLPSNIEKFATRNMYRYGSGRKIGWLNR